MNLPIEQLHGYLLGARVASRLTQREVATRSGLSLNVVRRIEAGDLDLTIDKFSAFGEAVHAPFAFEIVERP